MTEPMTTPPTPEEFLALTDPEDDVDEPVQLDPLQSIAESLRVIAAALGDRQREVERESRATETVHTLAAELDDLADKHRSLFELLADVEKIIKPSTSKLANSVREAITRWRNPEVPADIDPETDGPPAAVPEKIGETPAHGAEVEEWRGYAESLGFEVPGTMNRSQIRTMLGIEQPVEP